MQKIVLKSIGAVLGGVVVIAVMAFVTDTMLQWMGILPVTGSKKFEDKHSFLALSYHLVYVLFGGYLTARLAPNHPLAHALALGALGTIFSAIGLVAIIRGDLAPAWYGWSLIALSLPITWIGGKLYKRTRKDDSTKLL